MIKRLVVWFFFSLIADSWGAHAPEYSDMDANEQSKKDLLYAKAARVEPDETKEQTNQENKFPVIGVDKKKSHQPAITANPSLLSENEPSQIFPKAEIKYDFNGVPQKIVFHPNPNVTIVSTYFEGLVTGELIHKNREKGPIPEHPYHASNHLVRIVDLASVEPDAVDNKKEPLPPLPPLPKDKEQILENPHEEAIILPNSKIKFGPRGTIANFLRIKKPLVKNQPVVSVDLEDNIPKRNTRRFEEELNNDACPMEIRSLPPLENLHHVPEKHEKNFLKLIDILSGKVFFSRQNTTKNYYNPYGGAYGVHANMPHLIKRDLIKNCIKILKKSEFKIMEHPQFFQAVKEYVNKRMEENFSVNSKTEKHFWSDDCSYSHMWLQTVINELKDPDGLPSLLRSLFPLENHALINGQILYKINLIPENLRAMVYIFIRHFKDPQNREDIFNILGYLMGPENSKRISQTELAQRLLKSFLFTRLIEPENNRFIRSVEILETGGTGFNFGEEFDSGAAQKDLYIRSLDIHDGVRDYKTRRAFYLLMSLWPTATPQEIKENFQALENYVKESGNSLALRILKGGLDNVKPLGVQSLLRGTGLVLYGTRVTPKTLLAHLWHFITVDLQKVDPKEAELGKEDIIKGLGEAMRGENEVACDEGKYQHLGIRILQGRLQGVQIDSGIHIPDKAVLVTPPALDKKQDMQNTIPPSGHENVRDLRLIQKYLKGLHESWQARSPSSAAEILTDTFTYVTRLAHGKVGTYANQHIFLSPRDLAFYLMFGLGFQKEDGTLTENSIGNGVLLYTDDDLDKIAEAYLQENMDLEIKIIRDIQEEEKNFLKARLLKEEQDRNYKHSLEKDQARKDTRVEEARGEVDIKERREKAASAAEKRLAQELDENFTDKQFSSQKNLNNDFEDDHVNKIKKKG